MCAALGISRDEANMENPLFTELIKLRMGVCVIREGILQSDFHTVTDVAKSDGTLPPYPKHPKFTVISNRFYLADADFVVALAGNDFQTLEKIQNALKNPRWQLFLGRKAFVPDTPVYFREGIFTAENTENAIEEFLRGEEFAFVLRKFDKDFGRSVKDFEQRKRLIVEDDEKGTETRQDVPLSFAERRFTNRRVRTEFINLKGEESNGTLSDEDGFESAFAPGSV
jgi:CRISPR system Cascade subunit CasD